MERILRKEEVVDRTGLSAVSIWRLEKRGDFPQHRRISPNRVGWLSSEVEAWIKSRPMAKGGPSHG